MTYGDGHNDGPFDDPPIGGALVYVPTPAEENMGRGALKPVEAL